MARAEHLLVAEGARLAAAPCAAQPAPALGWRTARLCARLGLDGTAPAARAGAGRGSQPRGLAWGAVVGGDLAGQGAALPAEAPDALPALAERGDRVRHHAMLSCVGRLLSMRASPLLLHPAAASATLAQWVGSAPVSLIKVQRCLQRQ